LLHQPEAPDIGQTQRRTQLAHFDHYFRASSRLPASAPTVAASSRNTIDSGSCESPRDAYFQASSHRPWNRWA
jgi:hypothetical protein